MNTVLPLEVSLSRGSSSFEYLFETSQHFLQLYDAGKSVFFVTGGDKQSPWFHCLHWEHCILRTFPFFFSEQQLNE